MTGITLLRSAISLPTQTLPMRVSTGARITSTNDDAVAVVAPPATGSSGTISGTTKNQQSGMNQFLSNLLANVYNKDIVKYFTGFTVSSDGESVGTNYAMGNSTWTTSYNASDLNTNLQNETGISANYSAAQWMSFMENASAAQAATTVTNAAANTGSKSGSQASSISTDLGNSTLSAATTAIKTAANTGSQLETQALSMSSSSGNSMVLKLIS